MAQSCFVCFLLALLSSVCFSFIVYIVTYVDIGGQHWWSWYSLWQLAMIVLFTVSYYCFYCFIILANKFFFSLSHCVDSPHFFASLPHFSEDSPRLASLASARWLVALHCVCFVSLPHLTVLTLRSPRWGFARLASSSPHPSLRPRFWLADGALSLLIEDL